MEHKAARHGYKKSLCRCRVIFKAEKALDNNRRGYYIEKQIGAASGNLFGVNPRLVGYRADGNKYIEDCYLLACRDNIL